MSYGTTTYGTTAYGTTSSSGPTGYCTVDDVRRALREEDLPGDAEQDRGIVLDAITGQTQWLRKATDCHFYVPGGISEDSDDLVPTSPRTREAEELDVPSTPHPQHSTLFNADRDRYPHKTHGPFCRMALEKNDVTDVTGLEVFGGSGDSEDWVQASDKTEGEDWRLYVDAGGAPSRSYVDVRARSLPPLQHYAGAVRVSYRYGQDSLPSTVRRAVAKRAAADLAEEASMQIPQNATVYGVESKAEELRSTAKELLEDYL